MTLSSRSDQSSADSGFDIGSAFDTWSSRSRRNRNATLHWRLDLAKT